jgi:sortase (surface protein transpeptidase)
MSRRPVLAAALAVALAIAAACGTERSPAPEQPAAVAVAVAPSVHPQVSHHTAKRAARPGVPVRIEIPAIGVHAPVIKLGLNRDGSLEVPRRFGDTGWWSGGSRPGEPGPAVIVGHVDSHTGPAVFYRLGKLRRGDRIRVLGRNGSAATFTVQRMERHPKAQFPTAEVYGRTRAPSLRLVTCSGGFDRASGHYLENTIVFAAPVGEG